MSAENRSRVIELVQTWLNGRQSTEDFIAAYWPLRRCLLDSDPDVFEGKFGEAYGELDSAMDVFARAPEEKYEIDETTLRKEASVILRRLIHERG